MKEQIKKTSFNETDILTYGMPSFEEFLKLRSGFQENMDNPKENRAPFIFYKLFMICVGSKRDNTKKLPIKKISEIFTPSQEGYVLLELKNNWEKWTRLAEIKYGECDETEIEKDNQVHSKSTRVPALYTDKKYHNYLDGWSEEGICEYNKYCSIAKSDRNTQKAKKFEEFFLTKMKEEKGYVRKRSRKEMEKESIIPYSDLDNVMIVGV